MTDYTKLIERMRTDAIFDNTTLGNEAADAIEALQKEVSALDVLLEECKMDWSGDVTQLKAEHKHEIEALQSKLGDAIQSSAHWQHQFTELQAENERLKRELEISKLDTKEWHSQADALQSKLDAMGNGEPVKYEFRDARDDGTWGAWVGCDKPVQPNTWRQVRELYAAPKALAPEPDMFWNNDDPERQHGSIEEFLNDEICQGQPVEVGAVYTIQQAKRLPNVQIKVTSIDEESCEAEYEVLSAHGIGGTP